jgi:hypothetical protein
MHLSTLTHTSSGNPNKIIGIDYILHMEGVPATHTVLLEQQR